MDEMNNVIDVILQRKSVRMYEDKPVGDDLKDIIIHAAMRAPTAGNMMLYSIIDVTDEGKKKMLSHTCDNQPFIAKAPVVLLFLADYQRWLDYFSHTGVASLCEKRGIPMRKPEEGDLFLACSDALIAAQTAVIAAESLGLGSCYIGDIMENYETHRRIFDLPQYIFPIAMLCIGWPSQQQKERRQPLRFSRDFMVFRDSYKRLSGEDFDKMFAPLRAREYPHGAFIDGAENIGQHVYLKKFSADFSLEMSRSVRVILENWR